jgi:hypothetical protein
MQMCVLLRVLHTRHATVAAEMVASFVHACELRAQEQPPDGVLFGDALSDTTDAFVDFEEDLSDVVFHAFDAVLEVPGFFPGPP